MVLNESELFTLHSPCLLMNTSILFWKIVPPSCGIFFNAVNSKLEAGKPQNEKKKRRFPITLRCPYFKTQPCRPASPSSYTPPGPNSKHLLLNLFWEQGPWKVLTLPISAFLLSGNQEQEVCSCVELEPRVPSGRAQTLVKGPPRQSQKVGGKCFTVCVA